MDCSNSPGGPFSGKEIDFQVKGDSIEIQTRSTLNDLVALLAKRIGINIEVRTNPHSNLPVIFGDGENVRGVIEILESYELNVQAETTRR